MELNHEEAKQYVQDNGYNSFLEVMNEQFPTKDLGSMSTYWEHDDKYICKMRGRYGDIIIGWGGE